ncbi:MAG: serine hydrolase [Clostridia bacterium BRH_c25]|nr:MAG: serine hydrolase [Clostridia bacterium BRH_c25]
MDFKKNLEEIINSSNANIGVAIKNMNTGETIMINEGLAFRSASTIKLLIMSEILKEVKEGEHTLDEPVVFADSIKVGGCGILKELNSGHQFTIEEIITLMIILSDNTATNILIDMSGMDRINSMALELGLKNTELQRKMMDFEAAKAGKENKTCAEDMMRILELIYNGENIDEKYSSIMLDILKRQQIVGRLDLYLPEDTVIAHKTGDLDKLEHDVGIVFLPNCTYIICVLTSENNSNREGQEIIGKISQLVYNSYR